MTQQAKTKGLKKRGKKAWNSSLLSLPKEGILTYISTHLERVSVHEVRTQIWALMNELNNSQDQANGIAILRKIAELIYLAESFDDRHLLNGILLLIFFMKHS
ncbi:MAG: hypothetical protein HWN66_16185 [Candidatus Helarchaeota archaeon]|nr:hypothetical protein [Candidatus Helarchaeota archaeon]